MTSTHLDHGYDESKTPLTIEDLHAAAAFRGGGLLSGSWDGDFYSRREWRCAGGHTFSAHPYTVIMAGHWCPDCLQPPWNFDHQARVNPYFAQAWYADHHPDEDHIYPLECTKDILDADRYWRAFREKRKFVFYKHSVTENVKKA